MAEKKKKKELVFTKKDSCRMCYTCVRECPAKAIRIANGQAEVINDRCIACGNCTQVCSQGAKMFLQSINEAYQILNNNKKVIALLAPSFVAEFLDINDYHKVVGMIKALGFDKIVEVAFGADIIAKEYQKFFPYGNR
jgi:iron only hydrogenase large subunit-like protein